MKKYYVTYYGYGSREYFYMECDNKNDAHRFMLCLQYVVIKRGWTYNEIRVRDKKPSDAHYNLEQSFRKTDIFTMSCEHSGKRESGFLR